MTNETIASGAAATGQPPRTTGTSRPMLTARKPRPPTHSSAKAPTIVRFAAVLDLMAVPGLPC